MATTPPAPAQPPTGMNKPMTRRGCVVGVLLWAVLMSLPICLFVLATRGELAWQRGPFTEDRVWLVRADRAAGQPESGLAYSSARVSSGSTSSAGPVCVTTRVYFWLWGADDETLVFCECYQPDAAGGYETTGACP